MNNNVVSDAIKKLLGGLGGMQLYTKAETEKLAAETKLLQEAVNPTIQNLRLQAQSFEAKSDIIVARLQNVSATARAETNVVVAAAETMEVLDEQVQRRGEAMNRIYQIANRSLPAIQALLAESSGLESESQKLPEPRQLFQLPYRD